MKWCFLIHCLGLSQLFFQGTSFNFMTAVTICSDFWASKSKICHCFHIFSIYLPWSDGTGCHDRRFWKLSFKLAFSLSSFTFIKRLCSTSSLSAMSGIICTSEVIDISPGTCSLLFFQWICRRDSDHPSYSSAILTPPLMIPFLESSNSSQDWMKHKMESRLPGEISITSDMQMTPPLWQKVKRN